MMHKINVYEDSIQGSKSLANLLVEEINFNINKKGYCTINLPTGNSPINLYKELSDLYDQKIINFKKVVLFNLDEFVCCWHILEFFSACITDDGRPSANRGNRAY